MTLVKSLLAIDYDLQVVVSDNSDNETLRDLIVPSLFDERLVYRHTLGELSAVENFDLALSLVTGDYVSFIGDDDIIGPEFLEIVEFAKTENYDAVFYRSKSRVIHYFWPGVSSPRWGDMGGKLYFSDFTGKISRPDLIKASKKALLRLGSGPMTMPRIYLGIVSRALVEKILDLYGCLFGGVSPDVFSSHLLALHAENPIMLDFPFIIPGAFPKSASAARADRTDVGTLLDNNYLARFKKLDWDDRVPKYFSPYTVWAQSHVKAIAVVGGDVPLRSFAHLYALCFIFTNKQSQGLLTKSIKAHRSTVARFSLHLLTGIYLIIIGVRYVFEKVPAILKGRPGGATYEESNISDTSEALNRLTSELKKLNIIIVTNLK
jgi:glycosyltransferase involved in cell wall biosynthesis